MKNTVSLTVLALVAATQVQAADVTWSKDIKPLFDKQCLACHGATAPEHDDFVKDKKGYTAKNIGMRMDTYSHLDHLCGLALHRGTDAASG